MNYPIKLKISLVYIVLISTLQYLSAQSQPNILLIIADDIGIDVVDGFGLNLNNNLPSTPNIAQLQDQGVSYTNAWSTPVCTPTRAAIMSGKYGVKTGVTEVPGNLDLEHESLFSYINRSTNNTYASAVIGKWHISDPLNVNHPQEHGIEHYEGVMRGAVSDYYSWEKTENGVTSTVDEYITTHLTDAAIDWIDRQNQPWFLWLAHVAPHSPFQLPPADLYTIDDPTSNRELYLATIEALDTEIGRLLASLDQETRDNTVVIFIGDNGTPNGVARYYPSGHNKGSVYEGGIRVPMIISGDQVGRKGVQEAGLAQVSDLHATIIDLTNNNTLPGGIYNSYSLMSSLSASNTIDRPYLYVDNVSRDTIEWAIRNQDYKLIEDEYGNQEFYRMDDALQETDNLISNLSAAESNILEELAAEAAIIRTDWSCQDKIQNGQEETIDDCSSDCTDVDILSTENIGCCETPESPSVYYEYIENNLRNIYSNGFPNHDYCYNPNNIPEQTYHYARVDEKPEISNSITSITRNNGRPARTFGIALNGVLLSPAPGTPFIFVNELTGEFNWDWVFEPTNNQGDEMDQVRLDCATAHTNASGYHYHGEMFEYLETENPGITTATSFSELVQVGWAADGFPVMYKFGPDRTGVVKELLPSYKLKAGERPGDGITAPCGPYTGKYTVDYEYEEDFGDLDACNGIAAPITLETPSGAETFDYFYVVTSSFPQISRCLVGNVSTDFDQGNITITGIDADGDGYLEEYECDDTNPSINPSAEEIPNNGIDENCDGADLISSTLSLSGIEIRIFPNPSSNKLFIESKDQLELSGILRSASGQLIYSFEHLPQSIELEQLESGHYFLELTESLTNKKLIHNIVKI